MGKGSKHKHHKNNRKNNDNHEPGVVAQDSQPQADNAAVKLANKEYEAELYKLQVELVKMQDW
jgi:hypothetical protein